MRVRWQSLGILVLPCRNTFAVFTVDDDEVCRMLDTCDDCLVVDENA